MPSKKRTFYAKFSIQGRKTSHERQIVEYHPYAQVVLRIGKENVMFLKEDRFTNTWYKKDWPDTVRKPRADLRADMNIARYTIIIPREIEDNYNIHKPKSDDKSLSKTRWLGRCQKNRQFSAKLVQWYTKRAQHYTFLSECYPHVVRINKRPKNRKIVHFMTKDEFLKKK